MHDDLTEVAARKGRFWGLAGVPLTAAGPVVFLGFAASPLAGVVAGAAVAVTLSAWLLAGAPGLRPNPLPRRGLRPADPVVVHIAEGIGIAHGRPPAGALQLDHDQPNVAAVRRGDGSVLVVTSGAVATLTRDELEALCATQLAIADDRTCQRLDGMLVFWRVARAASAVLAMPAIFVASFWPSLAGGAFAALTFPAEAAGWFVAGKVKWWARVAADGVCVATTRHPEPLVSALRKLAADSSGDVPVGLVVKVTGAGTTRWAIPPELRYVITTSTNQRVTDKRTSSQIEDVNLLVRASLVRRICIEGGSRSLASRSEVVEALRRAGRAAADGGVAIVDGMAVGLHGVEGPADSGH